MPTENTTLSTDIQITAREIDFVTSFSRSWEHLMDILGIVKPIKKELGTMLKSKYASGALAEGNVAEGEDIPLSKYNVKEKDYGTITIEKFRKRVTAEAIAEHGYAAAVQITDDEFKFELQNKVVDKFYAYLNTGSLKSSHATFQMALAMAKGSVDNKFKEMHRRATGVVGFVNVLDVYEYIGAANITVQNKFGFQYVKDFMGYDTIFLLSVNEVARGRVIATAKENIKAYYIDPADDDFVKAGLSYTVDPVTRLIGVHVEGNYGNATSETFAIMGLTLFAEYLDAIAVVTVAPPAEA